MILQRSGYLNEPDLSVFSGFSTETVDKFKRRILLTGLGNLLFNHGFSAAPAAL